MCRSTWALHTNYYIDEFLVSIYGALFNESYVQGIQDCLAIIMVLWHRFECRDDKNLFNSSCKKIFNWLGNLKEFLQPYECKTLLRLWRQRTALTFHGSIQSLTVSVVTKDFSLNCLVLCSSQIDNRHSYFEEVLSSWNKNWMKIKLQTWAA